MAAGAREKSLVFKGNTLPGVYGAGAFQTLVNRDLVRPTSRLFIVGGGNVGLIAGYHALQAGIQVVGLCEALPECGGYKVHKDKLVRMGVPIYTSHTVLSANGDEEVASVTIAKIDKAWKPVAGHREDVRVRHGAGGGRPRAGRRVRRQGEGVRPAGLSRPATRRRSPRRRRRCSPGASAASRSPAPSAATSARCRRSGTARPRCSSRAPGATVTEDLPPATERRVPGVPLRAGDPLQPVHVGLPAPRHPHRGRRHHGPAGVRGRPVRRLREVRRHLPGPGGDAGRLPERTPSTPPSRCPTSSRSKSITKGDIVTVLDTEGDDPRQRRGDARPRRQGQRPLPAGEGARPAGHRHAHRRHPRAGAVGHGAVRAARAAASTTR